MSESVVTRALWTRKWRIRPVSMCTGTRENASSGDPWIQTHVWSNPRLANVQEEQQANSQSLSVRQMSEFGVGKEKGEILGCGSRVDVWGGGGGGGGARRAGDRRVSMGMDSVMARSA